jgi:hypothetical protein
MIITAHLFFAVMKSYFFFFGADLIPENDFDSWLDNDNFNNSVKNDASKSFLFKELEKLKKGFRADLKDKTELKDENGNALSAMEVYQLIEAHKNRISKVRLMINNKVEYVANLNSSTGVKYIVARSNWINKQGKKIRKFSKNLGPDYKVYMNGKIPPSLKKEVEIELARLMWQEYIKEYSK